MNATEEMITERARALCCLVRFILQARNLASAIFEETSTNDQSLYLGSAFVNLKHLRIAVEFFNNVIFYVTVSAKDLHCLRGYIHCRFGSETLGHGRFSR